MLVLEGGEAAVATTSGTSAIAGTLMTLAQAGDRVVTAFNVYGGTRGLLDNELRRFGVTTSYVHPADGDAVAAALRAEPRPAVLWADTLANPTLLTSDIPLLAELAHAAGVPLVIDNTFATPLHCNPLALGANLVVHSTTKFIAGHNDATGGVVLGPGDLVERVRRTGIRLGAIGAPFEAWLTLRGLRTLDVRLRRSSANALALAEAVEDHPRVRRVHYPGLPSDPGHAVATRVLHDGFGSMVSLDLGDSEAARHVVNRLRLVRFAETLGGLMTTVVHSRSASYRALTPEQLAAIGVSPGLLRFSIGIESPDDLITDVLGALD
jgi:cystathionine beta-lyase/cystathionine gamma-synthase